MLRVGRRGEVKQTEMGSFVCWKKFQLDANDLSSPARPESLRPDQRTLPEGSRAAILSLSVSVFHLGTNEM